MRSVTVVSASLLMALNISIASAQSGPDKIVHKDVLDAANYKPATCAAFKYDPNTKTWQSQIPLIIGTTMAIKNVTLPEAEASRVRYQNKANEEFDLVSALIATCPR